MSGLNSNLYLCELFAMHFGCKDKQKRAQLEKTVHKILESGISRA